MCLDANLIWGMKYVFREKIIDSIKEESFKHLVLYSWVVLMLIESPRLFFHLKQEYMGI